MRASSGRTTEREGRVNGRKEMSGTYECFACEASVPEDLSRSKVFLGIALEYYWEASCRRILRIHASNGLELRYGKLSFKTGKLCGRQTVIKTLSSVCQQRILSVSHMKHHQYQDRSSPL